MFIKLLILTFSHSYTGSIKHLMMGVRYTCSGSSQEH